MLSVLPRTLKALLFSSSSPPPLISPSCLFFSWSLCLRCVGCMLLQQMHRQSNITLTVLYEDKFGYMSWTDIPPNKYSHHHTTHRTHNDYQSHHGKQSICYLKDLHIYIFWKLTNSEDRGLLYFKKHNIKTGDSQLRSGSLRRCESSLNRTCGCKAWEPDSRKQSAVAKFHFLLNCSPWL